MGKEIKDQTNQEFLRDLASPDPAPGGGSASALSGAAAAALVAFVCRVTINKKGYEDVREKMRDILLKSVVLRQRLLRLAEEDKQAFLAVVKSKYSQESLEKAAEVPAETAKACTEVVELARRVYRFGNRNARTDANFALLLAQAAKEGALLNVEANKQGEDKNEVQSSGN